jgi:glycerol uptake facilitator-like aquaporin
MAHKKNKRRPKHRGNAAGVVEAKRKSGSSSGGRKTGATTAAERRADRFDRPPSWNSAIARAGITAVLFGVVMALILKREAPQVIGLTAFMFLIYTPLGYYTDSFIYRRRMAKRAGSKR